MCTLSYKKLKLLIDLKQWNYKMYFVQYKDPSGSSMDSGMKRDAIVQKLQWGGWSNSLDERW